MANATTADFAAVVANGNATQPTFPSDETIKGWIADAIALQFKGGRTTNDFNLAVEKVQRVRALLKQVNDLEDLMSQRGLQSYQVEGQINAILTETGITDGTLSAVVDVLQAAFISNGTAIATWGFKLDANGKVVAMQAIAASGGSQPETGVIVFTGCDLESGNYDPGVAGWYIGADGTIEGDHPIWRNASMEYTLLAPVVSPLGGSFSAFVDVSISVSNGTGSTARYTTDGTAVKSSSTAYTSPIHITTGTIVRVKEYKGYEQSAEIICTYVFNTGIVATPTISGPSGGSGTCTMACSTGGSSIYYSKNGGAWTLYTGGVATVLHDIFEAFGRKASWTDSQINTYNNEP